MTILLSPLPYPLCLHRNVLSNRFLAGYVRNVINEAQCKIEGAERLMKAVPTFQSKGQEIIDKWTNIQNTAIALYNLLIPPTED